MSLAQRPMVLSDLPTLASWLPLADPHAWPIRHFEESLQAGHRCSVAEEAGQVVGCVVFQCVLDEAELLYVVIAAAAQGKGCGRALLSNEMAALRQQGVQTVFLEVREHNRAARALYARLGFIETGRRRAYYPVADGEGEDAILMRIELEKVICA